MRFWQLATERCLQRQLMSLSKLMLLSALAIFASSLITMCLHIVPPSNAVCKLMTCWCCVKSECLSWQFMSGQCTLQQTCLVRKRYAPLVSNTLLHAGLGQIASTLKTMKNTPDMYAVTSSGLVCISCNCKASQTLGSSPCPPGCAHPALPSTHARQWNASLNISIIEA